MLRAQAEAHVGWGGQGGEEALGSGALGHSSKEEVGFDWALQGRGEPAWRRGWVGGISRLILWCGVSDLKTTGTIPPWGGTWRSLLASWRQGLNQLT